MRILIIIFISFLWFFLVLYWNINYAYPNIKKQIRERIESKWEIPSKDYIVFSSSWYHNIITHWHYLESIQYIAIEAFRWGYEKYYYNWIDVITDINKSIPPYYVFAAQALSFWWWDDWYEYRKNILEKWMKNTCNENLFDEVEKNTPSKNFENPLNPCLDYNIPFELWYHYSFIDEDRNKSYKYYNITASHSDVPRWIPTLALWVIWWSRENAFIQANSIIAYSYVYDAPQCHRLSNNIKNVLDSLYSRNINKEDLEYIHNMLVDNWINIWTTKDFFENASNDNKNLFEEKLCLDNIQRVGRSINIAYLYESIEEPIEKSYLQEYYDKWLINYIPIDLLDIDWSRGLKYYYEDWYWDIVSPLDEQEKE